MFSSTEMTSLPKGFAIGASKKNPRTKARAKKPEKESSAPIQPKPLNTEVIDIEDKEGASSKRHKTAPPEQSMVHTFLGASSTPYVSENDIKEWTFRTEEQVNQVMLRSAAQLHFHINQNQMMNARLRTRLANAETEKSKLQDKLKKYGDQLDKLTKDKDDEIMNVKLEVARLQGEVKAMETAVDQVTALNTSLRLDLDVLHDDRLHGWEQERKLVRDAGFTHGFNEWCSGFIANDPEYTFEKFDDETQTWVKDFKVREAASIKSKRVMLGLEEAEEDNEEGASPQTSPIQTKPNSPPPQDAPPA